MLIQMIFALLSLRSELLLSHTFFWSSINAATFCRIHIQPIIWFPFSVFALLRVSMVERIKLCLIFLLKMIIWMLETYLNAFSLTLFKWVAVASGPRYILPPRYCFSGQFCKDHTIMSQFIYKNSLTNSITVKMQIGALFLPILPSHEILFTIHFLIIFCMDNLDCFDKWRPAFVCHHKKILQNK